MFPEDLDSFLDTDEGAETVTVDGGDVAVRFEERWVEVNLSHFNYSGTKPTLFGKHSDFTGHQNDAVVVGSDNYTIVDIQPDGSGMALVILTEAE